MEASTSTSPATNALANYVSSVGSLWLISDTRSCERCALDWRCIATRRLLGEGSVRPGLSYVRGLIESRSVEVLRRSISQGALNWTTGETVAVKQIQLSNIPKSELGEIMVR